MSFPIRPIIHVNRGGIKPCNATQERTYTEGLMEGDDSDIEVIVPLSLLKKLRTALREEQAESARKDEQITYLHTLLRTKHRPGDPSSAKDRDAMENRCLRILLDLAQTSVEFCHKRSTELEKVLIPLLDPDSQRWHFPYANTQNYVVERIGGLTYVKITDLSPGGILDVVLPEDSSAIPS